MCKVMSTVALVLTVLLVNQVARAAVEVEVTIKSVDLQSRQITVAYKTTSGPKTIDLDVSRKAEITANGKTVSLDALKSGDHAKIAYEKELQIVTKINATGNGVVYSQLSGVASGREVCRFLLSVSEFGDCRLKVEQTTTPISSAMKVDGESMKLPNLPNAEVWKASDGRFSIIHSFDHPDELSSIFKMIHHVKLDRSAGAITFTPKKNELASVVYWSPAQLPITIIYDRLPIQKNSGIVANLTIGKTGYVCGNLGRWPDGRMFTSVFWYNLKDGKTAERTEILDPAPFELADGTERKFRLPLPSGYIDDACGLRLNAWSDEGAKSEIVRLMVQGHQKSTSGNGSAKPMEKASSPSVNPNGSVEQAVTTDNTFEINLGGHQVVFPAGYRGLNYFPDEPIAIIRQQPFAFLMTAGNATYLMAGNSLRTAVPMDKVLVPGGPASFDNGYAGASSAYLDEKRGELLVFYHAEDHEGMPMVSYNKAIHGAYWSVGLAVGHKDSKRLTKVGQILRASVKKAEVTSEHQGIGDVCVIPDASQTYLYAYFTDLTRKKGPFASNAKIGMARCKIDDRGRPGKWMKYYNGDFTEPGLGGMEGTVVFPPLLNSDVFAPHVSYVPAFKAYLMVCNVMVYSDHQKPQAKEGGIYYCYSKDGIRWSEPKRLVVGHPVPYQNLEYIAHPRLLLNQEKDSAVSGLLLYCYSPHWGTTPPQSPHSLASRSITFTRTNPAEPLPEPPKSAWELRMKEALSK